MIEKVSDYYFLLWKNGLRFVKFAELGRILTDKDMEPNLKQIQLSSAKILDVGKVRLLSISSTI